VRKKVHGNFESVSDRVAIVAEEQEERNRRYKWGKTNGREGYFVEVGKSKEKRRGRWKDEVGGEAPTKGGSDWIARG